MIKHLANLNSVLKMASLVEATDYVIEAHFDAVDDVVEMLKPFAGLDFVKFYLESNDEESTLETISESFYLSLEASDIKIVESGFSVGKRLITNRQDPIDSLQSSVYFLKSSNAFLTDESEESNKLQFLAKLTEFLGEMADHVDNKEYIFWSEGKALLINSISQEEFDNLDVDIKCLDELIEQVTITEHHLERKSLFKVALKKAIGDSAKNYMSLSEFISKLGRVNRLWSEGYFAYLHDLNFDEIKEKIVEKVDATHDAIGQVLSGAQIRILAIPLAIIVGASQFNKISSSDIAFAAFVGLLLLVVAGFLLFSNAEDDINAVETRFNHWTASLTDTRIIREFDQDINNVRKRIAKQKTRIVILSILNSFFSVTVIVVAAFSLFL